MDSQYHQQILALMRKKQTSKLLVTEVIKLVGKPPKKLRKYLEPFSGITMDKKGTFISITGAVPVAVPVASVPVAAIPPPKIVCTPDAPVIQLLKTVAQVKNALNILKNCNQSYFALDTEYILDDGANRDDAVLVLLQIGFKNSQTGAFGAFLYDVEELGAGTILPTLKWLLSNNIVVVHDGRMEAALLSKYFQLSFEELGVCDTQIVYEFLHGDQFAGLNKFIGLDNLSHPNKAAIHREMSHGSNVWLTRPFGQRLLQYASDDVTLLLQAFCAVANKHGADLSMWLKASFLSLLNFNQAGKEIVFEPNTWKPVTKGIYFARNQDAANLSGINAVTVELIISDLVKVLPERFGSRLKLLDLDLTRDLVLDVNKRPRLFNRNKTVRYLFDNEEEVFSKSDLESTVSHLDIGDDNRAILESSLHRLLSCIRNVSGSVYGITIRFGR